jgi:hypothetical protein
VAAVQREFGSWSNGLEAAGFARRINYKRTDEWKAKVTRWPKEKILHLLREWKEENGRTPRTVDWNKGDRRYPSSMTVVKRFGSWNAALAEAGLPPAPRRWPLTESKRVLATPFEERGEGIPLLQVVQEMKTPRNGKSLTEIVQELSERR